MYVLLRCVVYNIIAAVGKDIFFRSRVYHVVSIAQIGTNVKPFTANFQKIFKIAVTTARIM